MLPPPLDKVLAMIMIVTNTPHGAYAFLDEAADESAIVSRLFACGAAGDAVPGWVLPV